MDKYIFSTLTLGQKYAAWVKDADPLKPRGIAQMGRSVVIAGGANVATKNLVTPRGVMTKVSGDDYAFLKTIPLFDRHIAAGYIRVSDAPHDADAAAKDMTPKDNGAPLTPEDYAKPPTVGTSSEQEPEPQYKTEFQTSVRPGQAAPAVSAPEPRVVQSPAPVAAADSPVAAPRKRGRPRKVVA